jgi:hypothetical protein
LPEVIFEGGSTKADRNKDGLRQFLDRCSGPGPKARVVLGLGRDQAVRTFVDRRNSGKDVFLLIDSEGPLDRAVELKNLGISEHSERVFFMVQIMESWLLADSNSLQSIANSRQDLFVAKLNACNGNVEMVPKSEVEELFRKAVGNHPCGQRKPLRMRLLADVDPDRLANASKNASDLVRIARGGWKP